MNANIHQLVESFEKGRLTRRELIGALSALFVATRPSTAQSALVPAATFNHISISVTDRARSKQFYQEIFGLTVGAVHENGDNMRVGKSPSFVGVYQAGAGATPRISHLCFGIQKFDADKVAAQLTARGLKVRQSVLEKDVNGKPAKELYVADPDGISVQLQDVDYIG